MISSRSELIEKLSSNINRYSPVIVQGEAGIGKSFFIQELCKKLLKNEFINEYKTRYSWDVVDDFTHALYNKNTNIWKQDFLSSEIIVIEDFNFLKDKPTVLDELYQVFVSSNEPIIITTNLPIDSKSIPSNDLLAFFKQGTQVILDKPTHKDIKKYLKSALMNINFPKESIDWVINQKIASLSVAKGIIKTLQLYCEVTTEPISVEDCMLIVQPLLSKDQKTRQGEPKWHIQKNSKTYSKLFR